MGGVDSGWAARNLCRLASTGKDEGGEGGRMNDGTAVPGRKMQREPGTLASA